MNGLQLGKLFYEECVRPLLGEAFPELRYAAGRLGEGSDVLGFDTELSRDHDWGPKLSLFLAEGDVQRYGGKIDQLLRQKLPYEVGGVSTHVGYHEDGTTSLQLIDEGEVNHLVEIISWDDFLLNYLRVERGRAIGLADWLSFPEQKLRTIREGKVWIDSLGEVSAGRKGLFYYPDQVWYYLLAAQWERIDQEEPFVGRTGDVGDLIGSRIIGARLARDMMGLLFLLRRVYAPYSKWFGTAFKQLEGAEELAPYLEQLIVADDWRERENGLNRGCQLLARWQNQLGVAAEVGTDIRFFHQRPYRVIEASRMVAVWEALIVDPVVASWKGRIGRG